MTLSVLVTLDGSDKDGRAISVAAALVELADADARVLLVIELLVTPRSGVTADQETR